MGKSLAGERAVGTSLVRPVETFPAKEYRNRSFFRQIILTNRNNTFIIIRMEQPKPVTQCPSCGGQLQVRELECPQCQVSVRGRFPRCEFCELPEEQLQFLRLFVSRRGNLREVEREMGLSYPTVRSRLDDLLRALGYAVTPTPVVERQERRRQVMDDLREGRIMPEDALRALRE